MDKRIKLELDDQEFDTLWQVLINERDDIKQRRENPYYAEQVYNLVNKLKKLKKLGEGE